ncbi:hypothetical protein COU80_00480 [Candidatus Peregrinibacteria bacterium CG10_big_fil_rev_8_21_14_0_10_55_24]|nr:MAG: hypothetical protein COU80_00480 [Candidatus Peregrinibacteria bacterium CG10_big_fil_rev_8_21_14_0_10_55_24]
MASLRSLLTCSCALFLLASCTPETPGGSPGSPQGEEDSTISVDVDATFEITLESNLTTGYSWSPQYDEEVIEITDEVYVPSSEKNVVGAGGTQTFTFQALVPGTSELKFSYARPWESVQPIETRIYTVIVE